MNIASSTAAAAGGAWISSVGISIEDVTMTLFSIIHICLSIALGWLYEPFFDVYARAIVLNPSIVLL